MAKNKNRDVLYVLTSNPAPESFILVSAHSSRSPLIYIDENGVSKRLRYSTNHDSVFMDEQEGEIGRTPVIFESGYLSVPFHNKALQEFLDKHPRNGVSFIKHDPEKIAKEEEEEMDLEFKAMEIAYRTDIELLSSVVRIMTTADVDNMTSAEIRRDAKIIAREYPSDFIAQLGSPDIERKNLVRRVFSEKLLSARNNNTEVWFSLPEKKTRMMVIPEGEDMFETVENYMTSDKEGVELYKTFVKMIEAIDKR